MSDKITVSGEISGSINFAMQQNYVPLIRNLVVSNDSGDIQNNLKIRITFEPDFAKEFIYDIGSIEPGCSVEISPVNIILSTEFLFSLSEKMAGTILIELLQNDNRIFSYNDTVELLAYDEWNGLLIMPEIITAFVTPNHPLISEVLGRASAFLREWNKLPSFTGYQTNNPNNVKIQMAAIFAALRSWKIIYNNPPASYETIGQRVRLPHKVLEEKQGTCLDLSVLYAACLEAAGLFPLLIFIKGHAFCGCWLEQQTFCDCAVDDVSAIEKRIAEGNEEILLVECTNFTCGNNVDFERAIKHGNDHLNNPTDFQYVVDIQRSRGSGIRPIPVRINQAYADSYSSEGSTDGNDNISAPKELNRSDVGTIEYSESNLSRVQIWERKLLDFSLRNTLLNFRVTKNTLQLMTSNLAELEDRLSDNIDFRIMEVPSEWSVSVRDAKMYEIENERDLIENIASQEFKSNRIRTFLPPVELDKHLKNLYRGAKVSIEENGTNTLFLALGFLRWFESDLSEKPRYAPIVLVPVDIVKSPRNKGYVIRSRQEEPQINITLIEYLRQIFGLKIPNLDPLPLDEHGTDLPLVFNTIRNAVMDKKRWNIENLAFLGLFSFGQFVMWNDLHNRSDELKSNKVVSSLIDKNLNWTAESSDVTIDNLDSKLSPDQMAVPLSADSSQMLAIYSAATNNSFVLHGPPGTGKSQTITNMIANALYQGKSVLFVAEKMAALNVVQKRLASIGLDPFCLELHSNKTNKSSVLSQLNTSLEVGRIKSPDDYKATAGRLHSMRTDLNYIIEGLHCKRKFGKSVYEAVEIFESEKEHKNEITFSQNFLFNADEMHIDVWTELIRKYVVELKSTADFADHPLKSISLTEYSSLVHIDGYYDKGRTKQNKAEAVAVVNEIIRRLKDDSLKNDSIGVVTFSAVQQNLIDDLLSEEFAKYPELEEQNKNSAEPLFIKNLENVQGDERDVILFSIGYGPDKDGKVSMNFGPLNRDGGWRRLNVAISRARKSMTVYSTITPEQIDLSRTRSDGVAGLKGFLEFAGKGKNIITQKANASPKEKDALIEEISKEIEKLGYEVKRNIGYSEYKMDIGVVNPNNKQTYVLGILLDGKNCKNSATAKDRFVLQPDILTELGWNILRVWTLDWLDNPQKVIDSIAEEIRSAVEKYGKNPVQTTAVKANPDVVKFEKLDMTSPENSVSRKRSYQPFGIKPLGTSESFYESYSRNKIRILMKSIIETEAPISRKLLFKKVLSAWGITRSGNKVESILDNAITFVDKSETYENGSIFYWKKNQNPSEYSVYRVDDQSEVKRSIDDISSYEILNALIEVLNEQINLNTDDLVKESAKKLGFSRTGTLIDTTVRNAVLLGQQNNILKISNDNKASLC